jgi:UDP-N-acetyl-2-amino-2-deoxyglucuronate dehydrogenase
VEAKDMLKQTIGKRFAVIGVAGYVARRHLNAIRDVGGTVCAAFDVSDSVGQMDASFPTAPFFTDFALFDAYIQSLRSKGEGPDYVVVCSPNYLHRAHAEYGMRVGADVICEKPVVLNVADVDALQTLETETGKHVFTILQLRLNPANIALRDNLVSTRPNGKFACDLTYVTVRGQWYYVSWKGQEAKSGGIATNIGIHFYDLLSFVFGKPTRSTVHHRAVDCAAGYLEYEHATVRWFLSINGRDILENAADGAACRRITIGDSVFDLSGDFSELHTKSYREILAGNGFSLAVARQAVETVAAIRHAPIVPAGNLAHPYLAKALSDRSRYKNGVPV